jgi:hypothetical protein
VALLRGVVFLNPLTGLFFPVVPVPGGVNTGVGTPASLTGEPSTLDTAVDDDAFEEVDENELAELPDADRSVFTTKLGIDFADDDAMDDPPDEDDDEESPEVVDDPENEYVEEP